MAKDVFICYAAKDKATAVAICAALETRGISCWMAPRDILPSEDYGEAILAAINECVIMVLVLTAESNASGFVKNEVERAFSAGKRIIQFRTEDVDPAGILDFLLSRRHWLDASTPPLEDHLENLGGVVERLLDLPKQPIKRPTGPGSPDKGSGAPEGPGSGTGRPDGGGPPPRWRFRAIYAVLAVVVIAVVATLWFTRPWEEQTRGIVQPPTRAERLATAQGHLGKGEYQEAVNGFKDILDEDPKDVEARLGLAIALKGQGRLDQAVVELENLVVRGDAEPQVYKYLGEIFEDRGRPEVAVNWYRRYLDAIPGGPEREWLALHISELTASTSETDEAQVSTSPTAIGLGIDALERGDYEECITQMNLVLDSDPANPVARDYLARAEAERDAALKRYAARVALEGAEEKFEEARYEECARLLEEALQLDPDNKGASDLLERALCRMSQNEIAAIIDEYSRAVVAGELLDFYSRQCSPQLYESIAGDFRDMYDSYGGFRCTILDTVVSIKDSRQAEVRLTTILTGVSLSTGETMALLDGTRLWSMRKEPQGWRIFAMDYKSEGVD